MLLEKLREAKTEEEREANARELARVKELNKAQDRLDGAVAQAEAEYESFVATTDDDKQASQASSNTQIPSCPPLALLHTYSVKKTMHTRTTIITPTRIITINH